MSVAALECIAAKPHPLRLLNRERKHNPHLIVVAGAPFKSPRRSSLGGTFFDILSNRRSEILGPSGGQLRAVNIPVRCWWVRLKNQE
jgi:hypothetical protein